MKILVDVNHPAHVHLFKHLIFELKARGHEILVTATDKDVTLDLLKELNITYVNVGSYGKSFLAKLISLILIDLKLLWIALRFSPDVLIGVASFRIAHAGFFLRKRVLIFDDTEHSKVEIALYRPFATKIYTPSCFLKDLGPKQVRYPAYHELIYLHPNRFSPDPSVLSEVGINGPERFFIVRFVAWKAGHDIGQLGMSLSEKRMLVETLRRYGRVLITSEIPLDPDLEQYRIRVGPSKLHHLLYYASMYVGEGGTMATESSILGTPCIFINPLKAGTFTELTNKYGLMEQFDNFSSANAKIMELLEIRDLKSVWMRKREDFLKDKTDAAEFMMNEVISDSYKIDSRSSLSAQQQSYTQNL